MVNYVQVLEEENHSLKHSISQLQLQQEDLENRERWQNLCFRGIPETVGINTLCPYLLGLFNTLAPAVVDIDWRLDHEHRSLGPKPPSGARPRDVIVRFHYYDSKEALTVATHNKSQIAYKGAKIQIFSDLSLTILSKWRNLHPITTHLQHYRVPYYWGFTFRLIVSKEGTQYSLRDLQEGDAFIKALNLPPLPDEELLPPLASNRPNPSTPSHVWTPVRGQAKRLISTPQRPQSSKQPP